MSGEPQESDSNSVFNGVRSTKYSIPMLKVKTAAANGAIALLIMRAPVETQLPMEIQIQKYRSRLEKPIIQLPDNSNSPPLIYLLEKTAQDILENEVNLIEYQEQIDNTLSSNPLLLKYTTIQISLKFKDKRQFHSPNIVGLLPGSSDILKDEYLIIGAHYDHEGIGKEGIFRGADDNASGVAALLELAQAFSLLPHKPPRSILFISFAAEEKGTLGSQYYIEHPLLPLENAIAMINMDEIGRNGAATFGGMHNPNLEQEAENYLMLLYSAQTPLLEKLNLQVNEKIELDIDFDPNTKFYGASDHIHFHNHDIPSVFYFTGFHLDYSSVDDTPDKINYDKLGKIGKLIYGFSERLLNLESKPLFDHSIKEVEKKQRMTF